MLFTKKLSISIAIIFMVLAVLTAIKGTELSNNDITVSMSLIMALIMLGDASKEN